MGKKGFSLVELLVSLVIVVILLLVGIPAYQNFVLLTHSNSTVASLANVLQYTRSEAIRRNTPIKFCMSSDQKTCGGSWESGQIIIDESAAEKKVLRVFPALAGNDRLTWDSSLGTDSYIEFSAAGTTTGQQGSFYYCPKGKSKYAKAVIVSYSGRIRIADKRADGAKIECN